MKNHTKEDIVNAYNKLIRKYSMDKLTVEMIIKEAEISKATFYRHFIDKYDVMNYNYRKLLDHFARPGTCSSYLELYRYLFEYGRQNWKFLQNAFETIGMNSFGDFIASYSEDLVEEITRQNRKGEGLTAEEKLQMDVYTYGISIMYHKWIFDQYPLSSDQAAQALCDMMPKTLRDLWWITPLPL